MFKKIQYQLQLTFELELLKNKHLDIINYELENDGDYVGKDIVHGPLPDYISFDVTDLENIAEDAVRDLLKLGILKTIYVIREDDGSGNAYSTYPTSYCTNLCEVCDVLKSLCDLLSDLEYDNEEFSILEYLHRNLSIFVLTYKDGNIIKSQLF